jgi:hypothetical protein
MRPLPTDAAARYQKAQGKAINNFEPGKGVGLDDEGAEPS